MGSITQQAPPPLLPKVTEISSGITLTKPLSRQGHGPGIIILAGGNPVSIEEVARIEGGYPSPAMKWAEESYAVIEIRLGNQDKLQAAFKMALDALDNCDVCAPKEKVGLVVYEPELWKQATKVIDQYAQIVGAVVYDDASASDSLTPAAIPTVRHLAGKPSTKLPRTSRLTAYEYPTSNSSNFVTPSSKDFHSANEAVAHTRNLTFLKKLMDGPYFDLEAIWDEHTYWEFENRSTEMTMSTMVQEPYVNHVPTMTGGIGRSRLTDFYQDHFIFNNPPNTELELISRTVGIDRVVDEFIFKFTHDCMIDWLVPGIPPTHQRAEIPFTAVVNIRGDRLYHEHIAWDQATVLTQLGLMPEYLPFPYPVDGGPAGGEGEEKGPWEYRVPTAGVETAKKMRDKNSCASNRMFEFQVREVKKE